MASTETVAGAVQNALKNLENAKNDLSSALSVLEDRLGVVLAITPEASGKNSPPTIGTNRISDRVLQLSYDFYGLEEKVKNIISRLEV